MAKQKKEIRVSVYNKYNGRCAYCGCEIKLDNFHIDHITPLYRGSTPKELERYNIKKGSNNIKNYNPSCISCNSSKSTFTIEKWRKEIEYKKNRIRRDSSTFRILERFGIAEIKNISVKFYFEKF